MYTNLLGCWILIWNPFIPPPGTSGSTGGWRAIILNSTLHLNQGILDRWIYLLSSLLNFFNILRSHVGKTTDEQFQASLTVVKEPKVINDCAERGMKLTEDYNASSRRKPKSSFVFRWLAIVANGFPGHQNFLQLLVTINNVFLFNYY